MPTPVPTQFPLAGRSMHRWLVGIPVVLYLGTCVVFALHMVLGNTDYLRIGIFTNVTAVATAALAAVFGVADFLQIPNGHPAKKPAMVHGGLNATALVLFASNLFVHGPLVSDVLHGRRVLSEGIDSTVALALTGGAIALTLVSGAIGFWMAHEQRVGSVAAERRGRVF